MDMLETYQVSALPLMYLFQQLPSLFRLDAFLEDS
jgi:hypothetical protein